MNKVEMNLIVRETALNAEKNFVELCKAYKSASGCIKRFKNFRELCDKHNPNCHGGFIVDCMKSSCEFTLAKFEEYAKSTDKVTWYGMRDWFAAAEDSEVTE